MSKSVACPICSSERLDTIHTKRESESHLVSTYKCDCSEVFAVHHIVEDELKRIIRKEALKAVNAMEGLHLQDVIYNSIVKAIKAAL